MYNLYAVRVYNEPFTNIFMRESSDSEGFLSTNNKIVVENSWRP